MSIIFQNIDGVKSNFDALTTSLKRFSHKIPIIAIAETNIDPELSNIYQLTDYTCMQDTFVRARTWPMQPLGQARARR